MKRLIALLFAFTLALPPHLLFAATGCNYPTSHDSWTDKSTGDFLTVADVNQRTCAIEKLESGPLHPLDGSSGAPAYSFRDDTDTGFYRQGSGTVDYVSNTTALVRFGTTGLDVVGTGTIRATTAPSGFGSIGQTSKNNSGTPNTQFDLDADVVILRNSSNDTVVRYNPGAAITNNVSTAGPAANGRDQAGAFSASSWVHFYWIWNPGTSTLATLSSTVAPPTGPTLPSGYTHWSYAGAAYFNGSSQLLKTRILGAWAYYEAEVNALNAGTATTETAVSLTAIIPPNALSFEARFSITATSISTSGTDTLAIRLVSGTNWSFPAGTVGNATIDNFGAAQAVVPNIGQNVYYFMNRASTGGTVAGSINVLGYQLPNGGV